MKLLDTLDNVYKYYNHSSKGQTEKVNVHYEYRWIYTLDQETDSIWILKNVVLHTNRKINFLPNKIFIREQYIKSLDKTPSRKKTN